MEPAEGDGPERDGPDIIGDFFQSNVFPAQQVGDGGDSVSEEGRYIDIVKADPNGAWKIARAIWNAT